LMAGLHHELARRVTVRRQATPADTPRFPLLVVAIAELAHLPLAAVNDLRVLVGEGPAHGIVLLGATSRLAMLADGYLALFTTTLALRVADEETSIRLLGIPDAAALGAAGDLLVALPGRPPIRATGIQVSDEQLRTLAERLIAGTTVGAASAPPVPPDTAAEQTDPAGPADPALRMGAIDQDDGEGAAIDGETEPPAAMAGAMAIIAAPDESDGMSDTAGTVGADPAGTRQDVVAPASTGSADAATTASSPAGTAELAETGPLVVVECLGAMRVLAGDRVLEPAGQQPGGQRRANQYAWEALAVLAACPEGEASLWTVARALYPDEVDAVDEAYLLKRARTALNDARAFLRHQVPALQGMLILHRGGGEGGRYRLDWTRITSDAREFRLGIERARREAALPAATLLGQALGHYRGHLLADRPPGGWPDELRVGGVHSSLRAYYARLWAEAMDQLGHLCLQLGHPDQAATLFRRLFEQEPDDAVAERLLRAYEAMGVGRGAARSVQEDWAWICDLLREELDTEPTPELLATYRAVIAALGGQPLPYPPTGARRRTGPLPLVRPAVPSASPGGPLVPPAPMPGAGDDARTGRR
jgi:DNA-binding SARP family transcriptional activator